VIGVFIAYHLISGKSLSVGEFVVPLLAPLITLGMMNLMARAKGAPPKFDPVPEPAGTELRQALRSVGLSHCRLSFWSSGPSAAFPRPMALGLNVVVSKRVLDDFSPEALDWSVKTDARAAVKFLYFGLPTFFAISSSALLLTGLFERWKVPSAWYLLPVSLGLLSFVLLMVIGFRLQVQSDRLFTVTEADRRAAKEALSYPYFAQADRPSSKRWMFPRGELLGRARRLGLELERGYRF
jgi:hypothetical protein